MHRSDDTSGNHLGIGDPDLKLVHHCVLSLSICHVCCVCC